VCREGEERYKNGEKEKGNMRTERRRREIRERREGEGRYESGEKEKGNMRAERWRREI
jgi:hypothetical protein